MSNYPEFAQGSRRLWTLAEVCELTGYSRSTIERAIARKELSPRRPGERRFVHSELVRWLGYDPLRELAESPPPESREVG